MNRHHHQDWYIDEGAVGPVSGFLAFISDTLVKTWDSTHSYARDISKTIHRRPEPKGPVIPLTEQQSMEQGPIDSGLPPPANPVTVALSYPPQHLERVAYQMASETLPDTKNRSKHRKTHTWTPHRDRSNTSKSLPRRATRKERNKAEELGSETAHFAYSMLSTGLHGMYLCRRFSQIAVYLTLDSAGCFVL